MSTKRTVVVSSVIIALCAVAGMSLSALAADFYVSSDKSYGVAEGADPDHIFDDLQLAINAAVKDDTVWVEDGFEVDSGIGYATEGSEARIHIGKVMTVRSRFVIR